ncbi:FecR domain-containing protein [Chitinophaga sp.]|uniref:FecR family protein n=1 Tax=Chitinophaga sp. TaxID=1869181 RepID=UPI0025BDB761|nr:FecR domain-containing protein [Chitinophaga sp.]
MNISQFRRMVDSYLAGNASRREAAVLQQWLDKAMAEKELPADAELHRQEVLDNLRLAIYEPRRISFWKYGMAAAASVSLLVAATVYRFELQDWLNPVPIERVTALKYQVKKVVLPDSSVVVLNGGSTVMYPKYFRGRQRSIKVNGEAFFEVMPESAPFIITGPNLKVQVLGTSFVVTDSVGIQSPKVSVKSGRVAVTAETVTRQLGADEELIFNKEQQQIKIYSHQEVNTGWISNKLIFNESALSAVFGEIEKMYGVKISCGSPATAGLKFTGAFEEADTLDDILKVISLSYRLTIHKNKDGTILIK